MKIKILFAFALFVTSGIVNAQTYLSGAMSLTSTPGSLLEKSNASVEVGRQWNVFSLGLTYGRTTLDEVEGKDTCNYIEFRPNLNIFQVGKFTNTLTTGIGYVFGAKENLLMEFTTGIEYSLSTKIHVNIFSGQYYYSGLKSATTAPFFGCSLVYYFKPSNKKCLIKYVE